MTDSDSIAGYQLRLPSFEGPFDVLLRLVERSQLAITDISLIAVTDQFLAHVSSLDNDAPNVIAEFTTVGARLVLLKSRSLLPRPPEVDEAEPASGLARELIEYRAVKAAATELAERDRQGIGAFARAMGNVQVPRAITPPRLANHEANTLARALRRRFTALPSPRALLTTRPVVSLREMLERVLHAVGGPGQGQASFHELARSCQDRHELRTAFFAVLVLIRRRVVDAEQDQLFGDITLKRAATVAPEGLVDRLALATDD